MEQKTKIGIEDGKQVIMIGRESALAWERILTAYYGFNPFFITSK